MSQVENTAVEEQEKITLQDAPVVVEEEEEEDFLSGISPQDVPLACSIDNPDCEACQ